jgi:hypothetical protein
MRRIAGAKKGQEVSQVTIAARRGSSVETNKYPAGFSYVFQDLTHLIEARKQALNLPIEPCFIPHAPHRATSRSSLCEYGESLV